MGRKSDKPLEMTGRRLEAAALVAEGTKPLFAIAAEVGVALSTLRSWFARKEFAAQVQEFRETILQRLDESVLSTGVAVKARRIEALNERYGLLRKAIADRGVRLAEQYPTLKEAHSGLFTVSEYAIGEDATATSVNFDKKIADALLQMEEQAARELGQWSEAALTAPPKMWVNVAYDEI